MGEDGTASEQADNGIYGICALCWGLTPNLTGHIAWHTSRGEVVPDAHD